MAHYDSNGKYVIPIENTDLSFLPLINISPKHRDDIMPIWSRKNLLLRSEDCYYEFEVKDKQDASDFDTCDSTTDNLSYPEIYTKMSTNLCHICNLKVPQSYMREHTESSKHKTYLMISEIAVERVKKQKRQEHGTDNPDPSMHFCHPCVAVVPIRDKTLHFKSKAHKNACLLDKLLTDLLKLYSDEQIDDHDEREIETHSWEQINNKSLKVNVTDKTNDMDVKINNAGKPVDFNTKNYCKEIGIDRKPVRFESDNPNDIVNNDAKLAEYLNILNSSTVSTHTLEDINGEYLMIKMDNGSNLKVTYDNFHGIVAIGKKHLHCKLCFEIINSKHEHIYDTDHMEKLILPIDEHCIRELDETKIHCILCNKIIENADIHVLCSEFHNAQLEKAKITLPVKDIKNKRIENETSNSPEPVKDENLNNALQTDAVKKVNRHKVNMMPTNHEKSKINFEKGNKVLQDCATGSVTPKNVHFDVKNEKTREIFKQNVVSELDNKSPVSKDYFCNVCNIKIHANNHYSHISGIKHKTNEKLGSHYLLEPDYASNKLKCKICKCLVHNKFIDAHLNNPDHGDNYNRLLASNKMIRTDRNINCELCGVFMRIGNELLHIDAEKHKLQIQSNVVGKPKVEVRSKKVKGKDKKQHYCEVCEVNVPNNPHNIDTHYGGNPHKYNLARYLSTNPEPGNATEH